MPCINYVPKRFSRGSKTVIQQANSILNEYAAQGFDLTLRQLFYQFVARGLIPNTQKQYKALGSIINDARMAGLVDWDHIVDRTRHLRRLPSWDSPTDIVSGAATQFRVDLWEGQEYRPEVWIEKDALIGVIAGICNELRVPYFSCRGYTSQSEMWAAAQRLLGHARDGQIPFVIHFGDHDPSGVDMSRDIEDRLQLFLNYHDAGEFEFRRVALNMDQVEEYEPPPNPCKVTDSRADGYIAKFGEESWELDALEPSVIADLIRTHVADARDDELWKQKLAVETEHREVLQFAADNWTEIEMAHGAGGFE